MKTKLPRARPIILISAFPAFAALRRGRQLFRWLAVVLYVGGSISAFSQGSLTPPGAPAATFKTLQQVEPRIDLQNAPASAVTTSDANYHYIITQPGSYYLTANIPVTKNNGIKINAESVSLDLNGFEITRSSGSGAGIEIASAMHRASVRNGCIRGFVNGVLDNGSRGGSFSHLFVSGCSSNGLYLGLSAVVESCHLVNSFGLTGIRVDEGSTLVGCSVGSGNFTSAAIAVSAGSSVSRCTVANNTTADGIQAGDGCLLADCLAYGNTDNIQSSTGIKATTNCTVIRCEASKNRTSFGSPMSSSGCGIFVGTGSTVQNCVASNNDGDGFRITGKCFVQNNQADNNGASGDGAGIHLLTNGDNRIESNNVTNNDRGIDVDTTGNLIIKNTASGNPPVGNNLNYDIVADNRYGEIVDITAAGTPAVNTNAAASTLTSANSWANFAY